jgi:hypothetical protein
MQPPPRPGGGRWAGPFEAPPPGAGPCQLQPDTALVGPRSPCRRPVDPGARSRDALRGVPRWPRRLGRRWPLAWGETRRGTTRSSSCQRRLARLAPMDARAGPKAGPASVPGPEVDPALGGAASCESRAQTVPSAPPRHGRVRVPIASGTSESAVTVTRPRQIATAVAVAGDAGRRAEWPRGLRAAARAFWHARLTCRPQRPPAVGARQGLRPTSKSAGFRRAESHAHCTHVF